MPTLMGRAEGKVALITGAASGLGAADAELLAREGANVIIADIDENGAAVAERIGATFIRHDVTSESDWEKSMDLALGRFGKLDILINNAVLVRLGQLSAVSLDDYRTVQKVNSEGVFLGCRYGVEAMRKNDGSGSIINMSSLAAVRGFPESIAYSASKGAVRSLSLTVAAYCLRMGYPIRCNTILPGSTLTPGQQKVARARENMECAELDKRRLRVGRPEDIANLVLYLASDESVHVTGQEFIVDGGYSIM